MTAPFGKTAAIVITGNEILSGKVAEQNAYYLATELRALGVNLERISILPDRVDPISEEIAFCHPRFDIVVTSGGIGPTHDDVTLEGVAKGMNRKRIPCAVLLEILKKHYPANVDSALIKMASVPEGTELIYGENLKTPILLVKNIYIFPGISEFLKLKFHAIKERFRESPFYLTSVFLNQEEERIVEGLHNTLERFPGLLIGSYPVLHQAAYKVVVTFESKDVTALKQGVAALLSFLPERWIWKVEGV